MRAADGMRLAAIETGAGGRGVVLIPEHGAAGKCGWWEFAAYLAAHGYHVLLFDHRCTGQSGCGPGAGGTGLMSDIRAAVARLRQDGAARVALVGASQGGSEALIAGTEPALDVTGLVALSADELTVPLASPPDPATALAAVPRLRRPALFAVAASIRTYRCGKPAPWSRGPVRAASTWSSPGPARDMAGISWPRAGPPVRLAGSARPCSPSCATSPHEVAAGHPRGNRAGGLAAHRRVRLRPGSSPGAAGYGEPARGRPRRREPGRA